MTQKDVAQALRITQSSMSLYESDKRAPSAAMCVALRTVLAMDEGMFWDFMSLLHEGG